LHLFYSRFLGTLSPGRHKGVIKTSPFAGVTGILTFPYGGMI
jgi:hypothetical protein